MRNWIYAAVLLAGPALAQPTLPTKEPGTEAPKALQPAGKKDTAKAKPARKAPPSRRSTASPCRARARTS